MNAIKVWRTSEHDAGRPSSLEDFYKAHGICRDCRCLGFQISGYDEEDKEQTFQRLPDMGWHRTRYAFLSGPSRAVFP